METAIKIEGLTRRFGELAAVDDISLDIFRNEIFGLLGPNGAGKTTTISMICGLLPPTAGTIAFGDHRGVDRRAEIGYCPQENIFYPKLTCREQLIFIGQMYGVATYRLKTRTGDLLEQFGLKEKTNVRAASLSGGMKRRLNICLALIHDPEILVLDEPEAGLDPQSRIMVRDFIKTFGREKTIVLTTHNMDEADRLADRVGIMDHGRLLLLDTPHNLKKTIGEGDILEIAIENGNETSIAQFAGELEKISSNVKRTADAVLIKHANILGQLATIKSIAETMGLAISEFKLRENTLEDVFIHLTGRNLRQ